MTAKFTGACACGHVRFEFANSPAFVADCYCLDCQKSSGGVMASYFSVPESEFVLISGDPKGFSYVADTGNTLRRRFCPECGARVFTDELQGFPGIVFVMLGALDHPEMIDPPMMEIFTKRRLPWTKELDVPQHLARPDAS